MIFYGLYHGKSEIFTTIWENIFWNFFQASNKQIQDYVQFIIICWLPSMVICNTSIVENLHIFGMLHQQPFMSSQDSNYVPSCRLPQASMGCDRISKYLSDFTSWLFLCCNYYLSNETQKTYMGNKWVSLG